jgi:pectin methylesterase-like acyl-CoA thioesterase
LDAEAAPFVLIETHMTSILAAPRLRIIMLAAAIVAGPFARPVIAATVPGDFSTIQAAINAVLSGALPNGTTIDVQPGVYAEALVVSPGPRSFTVRGVGGGSRDAPSATTARRGPAAGCT